MRAHVLQWCAVLLLGCTSHSPIEPDPDDPNRPLGEPSAEVQPPPAEATGSPSNRFGRSAPLPRREGTIRIATYNLLNLFDHVDDPAFPADPADERAFDDIDLAMSDDRCRTIAEAIRAIDADILALQEVESLNALAWFRDTYLSGMGYDHLASFDVGYYRAIECSVMSRFEIVEVKTWPDASLETVVRTGPGWAPPPSDGVSGVRFQRSPLMVTVRVPAPPALGTRPYTLTLFSVHHKSGRDFDHQREAEALRIVELIDAVQEGDPRRNVIVLGDLNAAPWDKSTRVYLAAGMIDAFAHRSTREAEGELYKTHESDRVIDYILLNSAAYRELVIGSQFVLGTLYPPPGYDWRTDPYPPGYASDHYPVVIDLVPGDRP